MIGISHRGRSGLLAWDWEGCGGRGAWAKISGPGLCPTGIIPTRGFGPRCRGGFSYQVSGSDRSPTGASGP
jgi:hypothetical protein